MESNKLNAKAEKSSLNREDLGGSMKDLGGACSWMTANPMDYSLLKDNARANRKNMTEAESAFWSMAKGNTFGQRCIRQHIIGDYIVDFLFRKSKLIVEIDGGYHFTEEQQHNDAVRTDRLEHMGYTIVRFTNEQVLCDSENVINILRTKLSSLPQPILPPKQGNGMGLGTEKV